MIYLPLGPDIQRTVRVVGGIISGQPSHVWEGPFNERCGCGGVTHTCSPTTTLFSSAPQVVPAKESPSK